MAWAHVRVVLVRPDEGLHLFPSEKVVCRCRVKVELDWKIEVRFYEG